MPLRATPAQGRNNNQFISSLYYYEYYIIALEGLRENPDRNTHEQNQYWELAYNHFREAIEGHAFVKATISSDLLERIDFRNWLKSSKTYISRQLVRMAMLYPANDEDIRADKALFFVKLTNEWLMRIQQICALRLPTPWDEPTARIEIDHVFEVLQGKTGRSRVIVGAQYTSYFYSYLTSFARALTQGHLNLKVYNETWMTGHYSKVQCIVGTHNADLQSRWQEFQHAIDIARRQPSVVEQVNASIELYARWEELTILDKIIRRSLYAINLAIGWMREQKKNLPSIIGRIASFVAETFGGGIGLAVSPIIFPVLWITKMVAKKTSSSAFAIIENSYEKYLDYTFRNKKAWLGLLFLTGLAAGTIVPILHPLIPTVMAPWVGGVMSGTAISVSVGRAAIGYRIDHNTIEHDGHTRINGYDEERRRDEAEIRKDAERYRNGRSDLNNSDSDIDDMATEMKEMAAKIAKRREKREQRRREQGGLVVVAYGGAGGAAPVMPVDVATSPSLGTTFKI